jgi:hypothetical protein
MQREQAGNDLSHFLLRRLQGRQTVDPEVLCLVSSPVMVTWLDTGLTQ